MGGSAVHKWSVDHESTGSGVRQNKPGQVPHWLTPLDRCECLVNHKRHPAASKPLSQLALTSLEKSIFNFIVFYVFTCLSPP